MDGAQRCRRRTAAGLFVGASYDRQAIERDTARAGRPMVDSTSGRRGQTCPRRQASATAAL